MLKLFQLIVFGLLPYLAISIATTDTFDTDDNPGIHEATEVDAGLDAEEEHRSGSST